MTSFSAAAIGEAGKAIALAVVLSTVGAYVPVAFPIVMVLVPLALSYLTLRRGARVGLAAGACTGLLAAMLGGPAHGLFTALLCGLVGVPLGLALRRQWGFSTTLLVITAGAAGSLSSWTAVLWLVTGVDRLQLSRLLDDSLAAAAQFYTKMGVAQATADAAMNSVREFMHLLPYLLPSIAGVAGLLFASVSLALAAVIFPSLGQIMTGALAFSRFRLHWSLAYGFIGGLALLVFAPSFEATETVVRMTGLNLLVFFEVLFFLQGLAVAHWVVLSRRMGPAGRVALYGGALLGQALLQLTSWAGLLDTWFDYRKRFAARITAASTQAPPAEKPEEDQEESEWK